MNITTLEPTILLFLDINAGILIDGEKTLFCLLLAHTDTHTHTDTLTHRGLYYFQKLSFLSRLI